MPPKPRAVDVLRYFSPRNIIQIQRPALDAAEYPPIAERREILLVFRKHPPHRMDDVNRAFTSVRLGRSDELTDNLPLNFDRFAVVVRPLQAPQFGTRQARKCRERAYR